MKGLRRASCLRFGIVEIAHYDMAQLLSMWVRRVGVIAMLANMGFLAGDTKWQKSSIAGRGAPLFSPEKIEPFKHLMFNLVT